MLHVRWSSVVMPVTLLLVGSAVQAQTYKVRLHADLEKLDVKIEPIPQESLLIMRLTNRSPGRVRCELRYDASPQTPYRKTTFIDPGKTEQNSFAAKRHWFQVDVSVKCRPAEA